MDSHGDLASSRRVCEQTYGFRLLLYIHYHITLNCDVLSLDRVELHQFYVTYKIPQLDVVN